MINALLVEDLDGVPTSCSALYGNGLKELELGNGLIPPPSPRGKEGEGKGGEDRFRERER